TDDFYSLAESNSEADTIEYTFGRSQGPKEYNSSFEQAAFTLKTGQVSGIITTDYGWHILYCVSDFNEDATIQVKESIIEERRNELFAELYTEWSSKYDVVINSEAWESVLFD
ncbi:MAG: peptidylprolyl isomerase, partial [Lachnospira sp.]|nr:peptidylprolyl isomerase [Lachnospira sp.]